MTRILMINIEYPPMGGGTGIAMQNFLRAIAGRDDIIVDAIVGSPGKGGVELLSPNVTLYRVGIPKQDLHHWTATEMARWCLQAYSLVGRLHRKARRKGARYDLCHCWLGWPPGIIGWLYRRQCPYVIALRGHDVPGYERRFRTLERFGLAAFTRMVWRRARSITANSTQLAAMAQKTMRVPIVVIPNGVDTEEFRPARSRKKGRGKIASGKSITLVSTGRLGQRKGYIYLIRALRRVKGFRLVIAGQGSELDRLRSEAKGLDVTFLGYVPHERLPEVLNKADIFITSTLVEGMSNSVCEAMACGLPIVTTDIGGTRELINGNGVIISRTADADAIVEALSVYKKNPSLITRHGKASRAIALRMGWDRMVREYLEKVYA